MNPRPLDPEAAAFDGPLQLAQEGHHGEAVAALRRVLDGRALHKQHRAAAATALSHIARLAEAAGDLDSAEQALDEALRASPDYADLHRHKACVLLLRHKRPEARRALDQALRINPGYVAARLERALLDAREGLLGEALEALRRLGQQHPVEKPRVFRQGLKSLEQADWEEAEILLKQALQLSEPGMEVVVQQFQRLLSEGDAAAAARLVRQALRHHEGYADLHCLLGAAELEDGRADEALWSFARALELHPDYHGARVQFARALESLGDLVQAGEQIALVLQADPGNPQALSLQERWSRLRSRRRRPGVEVRKVS
ncbi:MAG TPA: tetratricopeptide repeat protein [Candidatus Eisenbacteria bacterium]|jgi:tetratricopeptide (TPR) repeat protein